MTICDKSFETPNFLDPHNQLSYNTTTYPPYIEVTLQGASSYNIILTLKVQLSKGVVDVSLFMIW